ncbi:MAG: spermidine/putrescine ABC transporter substrate-binding protein [Treponema sp.]|jgi:spermidine/putrescine-binding protein|nr:spermidine/putrescine ABC transporter substrate-binding protein [Treponema sp.]
MMKKTWLFSVLALLAVLAPRSLVAAPRRDVSPDGDMRRLTIYTWEEMFPQEILDGFTEATGLLINYVNFDTNETMLTRLRTAKGGDYDLVIADDYIIESAIAEGLLQKLDKSRLPNYGNINPLYRRPFYDPDDEYTVPYGAGVQTIVYDPRGVSHAITGYEDLWYPGFRNSLGVTANPRVINGLALKRMGRSYNESDPRVIADAGQLMLDLAPNIRLIKDDFLDEDLLSGEVSAAVMYTDQATRAMMARPDFKMVFPKEGIGYGLMGAFIPVNAPNSQGALAFLDYILDPRRGARCFEHMGYYCTFAASEPLISPEYRSFLTLPEGFSDAETIRAVSQEAEEEHERVWTAFKQAAGK